MTGSHRGAGAASGTSGGDVDTAYAAVRESGAEFAHPPQDEEWGVRRFWVRDPDGRMVHVPAHR